MIVQLQEKHSRYPDLTPRKPYAVIGIEADDYRLLNDRGEPYLYPSGFFSTIDPTRPEDWIVEHGDDAEEYAYPPLLSRVGFFEDYFDGDPSAHAIFWQTLNAELARVWA